MKLASFASLVAMTIFVGCATDYQKRGFSGGYDETQLGENIFQVSFRGNGYTSGERAADFALLRAAEVTIENGFRFFILADKEQGASVSSYTTPTYSNTTASAYGYGNMAYGQAHTMTYGGQTHFVSKPRMRNTIVCFKEKPDVNALVFDAVFVAKSLRKKYELGEFEQPPAPVPDCKPGEHFDNGSCHAVVPGH